MKKLTSRLLLLIMILAMTLSLTACGIRRRTSSTGTTNGNVTSENSQSGSNNSQSGSGDSQSGSNNSQSGSGDSQSGQNGSQKSKGSALYDSVADYVNSDAMQAALDSLKNTYSGTGMNIDMVAEGENKLVYIFAYESIAHTEGDGMAEALEAAMGTQDATFQQTANSIAPFVNNDEVIVEIRYIDMNGAVIYSKTYVSE